MKRSITLADFSGYFRTPIHTLLLTGYLSCLPIVVLYAARIRDGLMEAVGLWLALAVVFYVYFNPDEAFLYSCQVLGPFLVMVARGFDSMDWRGRKRLATLFIAGLAWANSRAFFG